MKPALPLGFVLFEVSCISLFNCMLQKTSSGYSSYVFIPEIKNRENELMVLEDWTPVLIIWDVVSRTRCFWSKRYVSVQ